MGKQLPQEYSEGLSQPPYGATVNEVLACHAGTIETNFSVAPKRYGVTAELKVTEPKTRAGETWEQQFIFGTDDDPGADKPEVLQQRVGGKYGFMRFCEGGGIDARGQDIDWACNMMKGKKVLADTEAYTNKKGYQHVRIREWLKPGVRQAEVRELPSISKGASGEQPASGGPTQAAGGPISA